ncbi:NmrA-like family domain-containing protein 1 [Escovopsis weberi]|uniref:NmrA-like family domain-containing protein 1 n=1 Tax=Escovopsis weberi TaxID=150374 RepID=A0A0M9VU44_ESCWE|nr:NmrA-like family domain-containing protein 1 [Escovopsis weberi]
MTTSATIVFVVGGTGAQGIPVVRGLVKDGAYIVRFLTRDAYSPRAKQLLALGNRNVCGNDDGKPREFVETVEGTFASEQDLRRGFRGATYAYVNIDGFNCGEKTEMFWAMRAYELAVEEGIKFFVYGNLDYVYQKSGFDSKFRCGHYDGKGRIGDWVLQQNDDPNISKRMGAADRANGMNLEVAIDLIGYDDLTRAFEKVSGHPARYVDNGLDAYWANGPLGAGDTPAGYNADPDDPATMTMRQNFTGFWNVWRHSGGNRGVVRRDFKLLDEIHPGRIRSAEEWFAREENRGEESGAGGIWNPANNLTPVLKVAEDCRQGRI